MRRIGMAHVGGWLIGAAALLCVPRAANAQIIYCGDGIVSPELSEQCDDGNQVNGDGCSSTCYIENCGDGIVGPDEQCDDGNDVDYDGCTNCTIDHTPGGDDAVCGDGVIDYDAGEQCDDGNTIGCDGCGPTCRFPYCGNGAIDNCVGGFEQCDDGNLISGDGCSATCTLEDPDPRCGNGVVDYGELCDDGNLVSGDGCSATCVFEYCGNGVVDAGEACDDGSGPFHQGDHGCDAQCQWDNTCGDGVVEPGEECDAGGLNVCNFGCCNESCHCPTCGDGVVQQLDCPDCPDHSPEQCDDGNTVDGDGCSAVCTVERCGNGVIEAGEQCDDGNTVAGDGCDAGCAAEGEPNCCSDEGGKPTFMEVRFTHPLVANATSITIDHGRKCGDFDDRDRRCGGGGGGDDHGGGRHGKKWESFKSKFVSDTETWTGAVPVDANSPMKVENSDLAITAVAGQTVTFTISGANKLNSNSSFMVTIGSDEFTGCIHTSCSQPLYVGQVFGTYFEVTALSGANVDTDNPFCQ